MNFAVFPLAWLACSGISERMGRLCSVCRHVARAEIDVMLIRKKPSLRVVAKRFGLTTTPLLRHRQLHVGENAVREEHAIARVTGEVVSQVGTVADELAKLRQKADELLGKAENDKDWKTALLAVREMRQLIESYERITAERRGMAADIAQSPSWKRLQFRLATALREVPGAIEAMQAALLEHIRSG